MGLLFVKIGRASRAAHGSSSNGHHAFSNSHFGTMTLWERLSSPKKSLQDATHTVWCLQGRFMMRIAAMPFNVLTFLPNGCKDSP